MTQWLSLSDLHTSVFLKTGYQTTHCFCNYNKTTQINGRRHARLCLSHGTGQRKACEFAAEPALADLVGNRAVQD